MGVPQTVQRKAQTVRRVFTERGVRGVAAEVAQKLRPAAPPQPQTISMLVRADDAARVDWSKPHPAVTEPLQVRDRAIRTAWIMSPPGLGSGGHQNLFRFIKYLESAGHEASIHLYTAGPSPQVDDIRRLIARSSGYADLRAPIWPYDPEHGVGPGVDAIFATGWETAYPSYLDPSQARRFYFVQDFEPSFYPVGSEYILAENTYKFGFQGITAGRWLEDKLAREYGMTCDSFDFATDGKYYSVVNEGVRPEIFFYARPVTARRAFELGVLALQDVYKARPDITINLAGWDVSGYKLPFEYVNHGAMEISELNDVYNRCSVALVLSLTNMSLLPLELLSAGVVPVVNEGPNNSMVSSNSNIRYVPASPPALARAMIETIDANAQGMIRPKDLADSVAATSWDESGMQFVRSVEKAMHG